MKFRIKIISTFFALIISIFFIYPTSLAYATTLNNSTTSSDTSNTTIASSNNNMETTSDSSNSAEPSIIGKSAIVINYNTGEILYSKNMDAKEYPASTTKIMTSILFAENKNPNDTITYTKSASEQPANSLLVNYNLLNVGDTMQAGEVMKAMFLISANDCAYMEADSVAGNKDAFADLMNAEVKKLGLKGTHFTNPNGLFNVDNYSTAYDMSVIVRKAFSIPWIREAMATKEATITASTGKSVVLTSDNKNLGIDGCIGGKTGYLPDHGRDLVNVYERNGETLIGVIYNDIWGKNDTDVFNDMKKIINYAYSEKQTLYKAKGTIVDGKVTYKLFGFFGPTKTINVPFTLNEDVYYYAIPINQKDFTIKADTSDTNAWTLATNPTSAKILVSDGRQYNQTYASTANITLWQIICANLVIYIISAVIAIIIILIILALIIRTINKSRRKKRKNKNRK